MEYAVLRHFDGNVSESLLNHSTRHVHVMDSSHKTIVGVPDKCLQHLRVAFKGSASFAVELISLIHHLLNIGFTHHVIDKLCPITIKTLLSFFYTGLEETPDSSTRRSQIDSIS